LKPVCPPVGANEAVPSQGPLQVSSVMVAFGRMAGGEPTSNTITVSHPAPSWISKVHCPGHRLVALAVPSPFGGSGVQSKVTGKTTVMSVTKTAPSQTSAQDALPTNAVASMPLGC
jgi:hypothetical protein